MINPFLKLICLNKVMPEVSFSTAAVFNLEKNIAGTNPANNPMIIANTINQRIISAVGFRVKISWYLMFNEMNSFRTKRKKINASISASNESITDSHMN